MRNLSAGATRRNGGQGQTWPPRRAGAGGHVAGWRGRGGAAPFLSLGWGGVELGWGGGMENCGDGATASSVLGGRRPREEAAPRRRGGAGDGWVGGAVLGGVWVGGCGGGEKGSATVCVCAGTSFSAAHPNKHACRASSARRKGLLLKLLFYGHHPPHTTQSTRPNHPPHLQKTRRRKCCSLPRAEEEEDTLSSSPFSWPHPP